MSIPYLTALTPSLARTPDLESSIGATSEEKEFLVSTSSSRHSSDSSSYPKDPPHQTWLYLPRSSIYRTLLLFLSILSLILLGKHSSTLTQNLQAASLAFSPPATPSPPVFLPPTSDFSSQSTPAKIVDDPSSPSSTSVLNTNLLAVMIEKRNVPQLIPILHSFLVRTPNHWPFQVWFGAENEATLRTARLLQPYLKSGRLVLVRFPEEFIELNSGDSLSRFLTRPWFWEQLAPAEHIFFFQVDSIICAQSPHILDDFLGYDQFEGGFDWVGAPWGWRGYPTMPWGGNGGFSLRKRSRMLDITRQQQDEWERERPAEDYWFAHKLEETTNAFPETDFAMEFAFESPPLAVIDQDWIYKPFGVHIGGGLAWGLCPGRAENWGVEQVKKLLDWCPEARTIIPDACLPH